ncbi:hypothetical protein ACF0H5_022546 [Mactra antiquata]
MRNSLTSSFHVFPDDDNDDSDGDDADYAGTNDNAFYLTKLHFLLFQNVYTIATTHANNRDPFLVEMSPTTASGIIADDVNDIDTLDKFFHMNLLIYIVGGLGGCLVLMIVIFIVCKCVQRSKRKAAEERRNMQKGRRLGRRASRGAVHPRKNHTKSRKRSRDMTNAGPSNVSHFNQNKQSRHNGLFVTSI